MTPLEKLPRRVATIIITCREGKVLCRGFRPRAIGETHDVETFWFEPGGKAAPPASSRRAIAEGYLKACDAGLLQDGNAQAFAAVEL